MEPTIITEGTMEQEEAVFPCKGCGEVLEEGKAFELAGNRWHIDCFRCNSCRTLLDSDANLLLLGDGSLICNNCTYSCTVCKNKIEDLAILTGEQAFCAKCFKCRNCKRKIENLKYAKTSQGIFCMSCHESLMHRRRKHKSRQTATRTSSNQSHHSSAMDKSLPALPPHVAPDGAFSPDPEPMRQSFDTAGEDMARIDSAGSVYSNHNTSPRTLEDKENFLLTPRTFGDSPATFPPTTTDPNSAEEFEVPLSLDPSPNPSAPQPPRTRAQNERPNKDYFAMPKPSSASNFRDNFGELLTSTSRSTSRDRPQPRSRASPHIAYQEKGRSGSGDNTDSSRQRKESGGNTPPSGASSLVMSGPDRFRFSPSQELDDPMQEGRFKLQEAPKRRSSGTPRSPSTVESPAPGHIMSQARFSSQNNEYSPDYSPKTVPPNQRSPDLSVPKRNTSFKPSPLASPVIGQTQFERPARGDSMRQAIHTVPPRKEVGAAESDSSSYEPLLTTEQASVGEQETAEQSTSRVGPASLSVGDAVPPPRSARRPLSNQAPPQTSKDQTEGRNEIFTAPREPPRVPPSESRHQQNESLTSIGSEQLDFKPPSSLYASQPRSSEQFHDGIRGEEEDSMEEPGLLRKMSKAVRHGRSHSDKIGSASPKWTSRGSRNASVDIKTSDISSPIAATSGEGESVDLRNKLRYSQQRVAELEAEKMALQEKVNGTEDIRHVNTELKQKRSTVAMLDTQRETVIRELEIMTEQLQKAKNTNQVLDIEKLRSDVMREFAQSMTGLKETLFKEIEALMVRKNELTSEISNLIQMKDKGFQEYESLSSKNQQLGAHNNQLVQSIQDLYRQGSKQPNTPAFTPVPPTPSANGLGIYSQLAKEASSEHLEVNNDRQREYPPSQISNEGDIEAATIVAAPKVVDVRKAGQGKKFLNWKKGRDTVTKGVTKGFKGAFGGQGPASMREDGGFQESAPYASMQGGDAPQTGEKPLAPSRIGQPTQAGTIEQGRGAWLRREQPPSKSSMGGSSLSGTTMRPSESSASQSTTVTGTSTLQSQPAVAAPPADTTLFGSDLSARCEFERCMVPTIVLSCINEVTARGLDQEGIYRKSGSSTQVKTVQSFFESGSEGFDISDPDLDIHAVTGCLKQYFRRLPNPLITFEGYDGLLEAVKGGDEGEDKTVVARRIKTVVEALPRSHQETLQFLCFHLGRVMELQAVNLMTPLNLAVVFAPTIMRPLSIEREIADTAFQRSAVQVLLENYNVVFEGGGS